MARRRRSPSSTDGLRDWLHAEAVAFRATLTTRIVVSASGQGALRDTEPGPTRDVIWGELSGPVDALAAGEAYRFHRYQLPDNHPASAHRRAGDPSDLLELGSDDVLRLVAN